MTIERTGGVGIVSVSADKVETFAESFCTKRNEFFALSLP